MDLFILVCNAALFFVFAFYYKKRWGFGNLGVLYVFFYAASAAFACHLYATVYNPKWIGINPLCLLYMMFFIIVFAKFLMKETSVNCPIAHPPVFYMLPIYVIVILLSLSGIVEVWENFHTGIISLAVDESYGQELYSELNTSVHTADVGGDTNVLSVLSNITKGIAPILFLYYLTTSHKKIWIVIGLGLSSMVTFMLAISSGSRSAIVQQLMSISAAAFFLWKYYNKKTKRISFPILIAIFSVIIAGFMFITLSRSNATHGGNTFEFIESYAAQSYLFFGSKGFKNEQIRNGDRTIPLLKSIFTDDVARSYAERERKYTKMAAPESVFSSFVGDCVFDFGIIGGSLFLAIFYALLASFFKKRKRKQVLYVDQIIIIYLVAYLLNGFYLWPFSDYGGNLFLVTSLLIAVYIKRLHYVAKVRE